MGYAIVMGTCYACKQPFSFNPRKVPSYQGEPICEPCIEKINTRRRRSGYPEWPVSADAYEAIEEGSL